jgi:hypothetical protein
VPGGRGMQLAMCLGTAVLGALLLLWGGSSELGPFGWVFLGLGAIGALVWFVVPHDARR